MHSCNTMNDCDSMFVTDFMILDREIAKVSTQKAEWQQYYAQGGS